jgi:hypothetical protein
MIGGGNHQPAVGHWQTLSRNVASSTPFLSWVRTHNFNGDIHWLHIGSYKSNYHKITTTTDPELSHVCHQTFILIMCLSILYKSMQDQTDIFLEDISFSICVCQGRNGDTRMLFTSRFLLVRKVFMWCLCWSIISF